MPKTTAETIFSEFFLDQLGIKPASDSGTTLIDCVGSLEETMETKTITKSCRGRVKKSRTKGSSGTLKITTHMPYQTYLSIYGMDGQSFADGVHGYGTLSMHKECLITAKVLDEDDNVQYRAYPCAVATSKSCKVDDDATEVAMVELEFSITADDNEMIVYQALEGDITEAIATGWMGNWTSELVAPTV